MSSIASFRPWLACALLAGVSGIAEARTWTNYQGRQIEAEYVRLDGQNVVLLMAGREVSVPLANLSDADKQFIFQRIAGVPEANPAPAGPTEEPEESEDGKSEDDDNESSSSTPSEPRRADETDGVARMRNWTDRQGKHIRAKYIRIHGAQVVLMQGRKTVTCAIANLSAEDQEFLWAFLNARGESDLMPSPEQLAAQQSGGPQGAAAMPVAAGVAGAAGLGGHAQAPAYAPPPYTVDAGGGMAAGPTFPVPPMPTYTPPPFTTQPPGYAAHAATTPMDAGGMHGAAGASAPPYDVTMGNAGSGGYPGHAADPTTAMPGYTSTGMPSGPGSHDMASTAPLGGPPPMHGMGPDLAYNPMPPTDMSMQTQVVEYYCSSCGKSVPEHINDRCPHCGIAFAYVEQPDGSRKYNGLRWGGGIGTIIAVIIGVVIRVIMGAQRR